MVLKEKTASVDKEWSDMMAGLRALLKEHIDPHCPYCGTGHTAGECSFSQAREQVRDKEYRRLDHREQI